jgi:antitoxin (DNA-binding transcriptional repressor) of toxin-antitoxin stability system
MMQVSRLIGESQEWVPFPSLIQGMTHSAPFGRIITMSTISVEDIQRNPLAFLDRIAAGEALLVMQGERPVAEVRPMSSLPTQPRPYGLCAGEFKVPADFDRPLPDDVLQEFEGA